MGIDVGLERFHDAIMTRLPPPLHLAAAVGRLERSRLDDAIWRLTSVLRAETSAEGSSVLELIDQTSQAPRLRKHYEHHGRRRRVEFLARGSIASWVIENDRPLILNAIDHRGGKRPVARGLSFQRGDLDAPGHDELLEGIVAPETIEEEASILYWPLRLHDGQSCLVKLAHFEQAAFFDMAHLRLLEGAEEVIAAFLLDWRALGGFSLLLSKAQSVSEFLGLADSLFFYKEMASGMFHAVGNNLNSLDAELLLDESLLATEIPIERFDMLARVKNSRAIVAASKQIIRRAQERARASKPRAQDCDLIEDVVRPALEFVKKRELAKDPTIEIDHSFGNGPFPVVMDRVYGEECFVNLMHNAVWAIRQHRGGGRRRIFLAARRTDDGSEGRVEIEDTGIGIDPSILPRLFEPFFTTKKEGTGLGLYFARRIFEYFGGSVSIKRSLPKKGTTMEVRLPLRKGTTGYGSRST